MLFIEEEKPSLLIPISVSLIIHVLVMMSAVMLPAHMPKQQKETIIEVWPTTPEQIDQARKGALRIADIDEPAVQKKPKRANFAGLYDSAVDKETVAIGRDKKGRGGDRARKSGAKKRGDRLLDFDENLFAMREPVTREPVTRDSSPDFGKVSIGGASGDFFPDVNVGERTYLNVLRYPEVSYFVRLKRVFRTTFDPGPPLRSYFSTNRVARGSVEVVLAVGVDETGKLSELFVLRGSNIPEYDREAMRTVRASAPFAAPPKKFLADDGQLRMMWTFTVYL